MPKFQVSHSERVSYEPVIVEAETAEEAEQIVRNSDPRDFNEDDEYGDDYSVEAVPADDHALKTLREVEVKDDAVVPFNARPEYSVPCCKHVASGEETPSGGMCPGTDCKAVFCSEQCREEHEKKTGHE